MWCVSETRSKGMRRFSVLALIALLPLLCGSLPAQTLASTLAKIDQAAAGFRGLSADVKKISHTAVINEDTVDIGTILVKRPKPNDVQMLIDIRQPDPKKAAIDGRK